ncbi:MAG TPA: hypothetical protein VKA34_14505 [Balneolales bacterium]|nr:hypothetical protein [Balneolales bacterium]
MKELKPWSQIQVSFLSNDHLNAIKKEILLLGELLDLNEDQFSFHQTNDSFKFNDLENADVFIVHSLPIKDEALREKILERITRQNLPCWIYNRAFDDFCHFLGSKVKKVTSGNISLTLTDEGKKDPVFSIMPDTFKVSDMHSACLGKEHPKSCEVLVLYDEHHPAVIKMKSRPVYVSAFHPKNHKEILMQFFREYVGYLEYLA